PVPLWFVAGATTVTVVSGTLRTASTSAAMPGASTPSSLVTSTCSGRATGADVEVRGALLVVPSTAGGCASSPELLHAGTSAIAASAATATRRRDTARS